MDDADSMSNNYKLAVMFVSAFELDIACSVSKYMLVKGVGRDQ